MPFLLEESEKGQKAYESLLIKNPKLFSILSSELALKIIEILSKQPSCAMDIARKLKQHEQKIYYHLRNLEKIGLIKLLKTEERVGATAKIYTADFPVVSFKLFDGKEIVNSKIKIRELNFLKNFIEDGKLN
ncbi:MAG: winged helix-turn-helix domain-containing protein, partial [Candidatus Nanoarchaeia archaeon]